MSETLAGIGIQVDGPSLSLLCALRRTASARRDHPPGIFLATANVLVCALRNRVSEIRPPEPSSWPRGPSHAAWVPAGNTLQAPEAATV